MDTSLLWTDLSLGEESPSLHSTSLIPGLSVRFQVAAKNASSRWGIKQVGISFGFIHLLFSNESSWGQGKIPGPQLLMTALLIQTPI